MTRIVLLLSAFMLVGSVSAQTVSGGEEPSLAIDTAKIPMIAATFDGDRSVVFESPKDSCNDNDIPDSMARAFRDFNGTVHLMAASSELFQNLGPTLEDVRHNCAPAFISAGDPNPSHYNDQFWLSSFYTFDGLKIAALSHTEYHGWTHPGECNTTNLGECEYDSDTYHLSTDGGYNYDSFPASGNFVAGVPYKYAVDGGPTGFSVDTPIIHYRGWFYAVTTSYTWPPNCTADSVPTPCLINGGAPIRTRDVFDPSSWRAWSGQDFSVSFADPYTKRISDPQAHVYAAVPYMSYIYAINIFRQRHDAASWDVEDFDHAEEFQKGDIVFATLWDVYDNLLGPQGLYF